MSLEVWKSIENYYGFYEVSNLGRVKALERIIIRKDGVIQKRRERIKTLTENSDGYLTVKLSKDGIDERVAVHIIVAKAFVDGWFEGAEVNHIDFNRKNNTPENLEWITHRNNIEHTLLHGRHISQWGDLSGSNNPNYGNHKLREIYSDNKVLAVENRVDLGLKTDELPRCECIVKIIKHVWILDTWESALNIYLTTG